jgi:hypothetical protein
MGLTLHYDLRLPGSTDAAHVDQLLAQLRAYAVSLPFEAVSPVVRLCEPVTGRPAMFLRLMGEIISEPFPEVDRLPGDVETGRGFLIDVGDGCEAATVAFLMRGTGDERDWFWRCSCKTQYATNVSDAHFAKCHIALVTLLDRMQALGIELTVCDEGGYWEKRNEAALVAEVRRWDHLMAKFAGRLSDILGDRHEIVAPILARPDFEHLEMGQWRDDASGTG